MREMCGDVGVEESLRIWDTQVPGSLGAVKNRSFDPVYYDSPACSGPQSMPSEITSMATSPYGFNWVQPRWASVPEGVALGFLRYTFDSSGSFDISFN